MVELGKPILKESEAFELTPSQRIKFDIVPTITKGDDFTQRELDLEPKLDFLQKLSSDISLLRPKLREQRLKELETSRQVLDLAKLEGVETKDLANILRKRVKTEVKLAGATAAGTFVDAALTIKSATQLPGKFIDFVKDPENIKRIPSQTISVIKATPGFVRATPGVIKEEGIKLGKFVKLNPTEALVKVGSEILLLKGTGKVLQVVGKISTQAATRSGLTGKFAGVKNSKIAFDIPEEKFTRAGKEVFVKERIKTTSIRKPSTFFDKFSGRKPGQFKKFQKEPGIELKLIAGKLPPETLKKQIELAGRNVNAVSAQANRLIELFKSNRIVRKPIPGEADLSSRGKNLLKKFDDGKITKNELIELDLLIAKEAKRGILERSFFADPRGRLRTGFLRLKETEAKLSDLFKGNVRFKSNKPQALVFEKAKIQNFPKTPTFDSIRKKLKQKNPNLTSKESNALLDFQVKKSGNFKPVGFLSLESEITLAPGEIIQKIRKLGVSIIDGRRVPVISARVVKATEETKDLMKKAKANKITNKELNKLNDNLRKETGFSGKRITRNELGSDASNSFLEDKPIVPVSKLGGTATSRISVATSRPGIIKKVIQGGIVSALSKPRKVKTAKAPPIIRTPPIIRQARVSIPGTPLPTVLRTLGISRPSQPPVLRTPPPPTFRSPPPPITRTTTPIKRILFGKPKKKKIGAPVNKQGYNALVKEKGKFIKLNVVPLTKNKAQDLSTFVTDRSLSATYKIKKTNQLAKKPVRIVPNKYFDRSFNKFRPFKKRKGVKIPLENAGIERRTFRLDTRSEVKKIQASRFVKQLSTRLKKPKRLIKLK